MKDYKGFIFVLAAAARAGNSRERKRFMEKEQSNGY